MYRERFKMLRDAVLMWWLPPSQRLLALILAGHLAQALTDFRLSLISGQ
jgi:hypothetical protein